MRRRGSRFTAILEISSAISIGIEASNHENVSSDFINGVVRSGLCHCGGGFNRLVKWGHNGVSAHIANLLYFPFTSLPKIINDNVIASSRYDDGRIVLVNGRGGGILFVYWYCWHCSGSGFFVLFEAVDPEALVVTTIIRSREKNRGKWKTAAKKDQLFIAISHKV